LKKYAGNYGIKNVTFFKRTIVKKRLPVKLPAKAPAKSVPKHIQKPVPLVNIKPIAAAKPIKPIGIGAVNTDELHKSGNHL
jgi:hypothetical protein